MHLLDTKEAWQLAIDYFPIDEVIDHAFALAHETGQTPVLSYAMVNVAGEILLCVRGGSIRVAHFLTPLEASLYRNEFWKQHGASN